jgi:hypothetical protein
MREQVCQWEIAVERSEADVTGLRVCQFCDYMGKPSIEFMMMEMPLASYIKYLKSYN